jgi:hypothetical protein
MKRNQVSLRSSNGRALALVMRFDRVFLLRELFVALAIILLVSGLAFAQTRTAGSKGSIGSQQVAANTNAITAKGRTIVGETRQLGKGKIRSWLRVDGKGNPTAVGVTFDEATLSTVPNEPPAGHEGVELSLALPQEGNGTMFKHVWLGWNPRGHEPEKIYDVAHFDFHFYTISEQERNSITVSSGEKQPAAEFVPAGYIFAPNGVVPKMGGHWVNPLSQEFKGQPFTKTFLYGSSDGRLIFAEPMITRAFFEAKTNVTETITLPAKVAESGYYPTKYSVNYDPATKEYTVALEGMTLR